MQKNIYKKGLFGPLVIMILVVASAILLFVFAEIIFSRNSAQGAIEACRISVLSQAKLEIAGASPLSLNCLRRYIDIYNDHVEFGNQPDKTKTISVYNNGKKVKRYNQLNNDIVNYVVAEEMRICWYQFGEAKTEIFPNNEKLTEIIGTADDDICFICSEIEFIDIKNKQYTGLIEYLKNNYPKDKKYTYWEYFNQPSLSEYTLEAYLKYIETKSKKSLNELLAFDSNKTYAVIFYKDFDQSSITDLLYSIGFIEEPGDSPAGKSGYHVLVLPTENLEEICEIQAN